MTIIIDDAGTGDLLFGAVIGAYNLENDEFRYDCIDVKYFQANRFQRKAYLKEATRIVFYLLSKMDFKENEDVAICQGYIFEKVIDELKIVLSEDRIRAIKVVGRPQEYVELAYEDELRNLGYEPLKDREKKRAKSFFHMMRWLKKNPDKIKYAKTGWPRLSRYRLFRKYFQKIN